MSKITVIEPNPNDKDNVKAYMVKGERGDDGVSPTFETSKEGHVATITITDVEGTHNVELEDGQDGRDLTGGVPTSGVIGWLGNEKIYTCDGTEIGDYYFIYGSIYYYFTMPTVEDGDVLVFNTDDLELTLNETTITTSTTGAGTETELTFVDNIPNGYEFTDETFGGGGESLPVGTEVDFDGDAQDIPTGWEVTTPRLVKLWENESPTSNFATQDVTLSGDDYDYLICFFRHAKANPYMKSVTFLKGWGGIMDVAWDYSPGQGTYYIAEYYRGMARVSDTKYTIGDCYVRYNSGTTIATDNTYLIPVYIYGGKF